jgi:D-threonate/D-erythronate kinase
MGRAMTKANRDTPVFILADDLTGSADAANYFRTERRRVRVTFDADRPWDLDRGPDVVQVYDAESRGLSPEAAQRRVGDAAAELATRFGSTRLFKKVDSTLRGNLGIEIEAALRQLRRPVAVLAPSFPANGRTVRDGRVLVDGIPLTQTSAGHDPRAPVHADRVADVVRATSAVPVYEVGLAVVRQGEARLAAAFRAPTEVPAIVVCDAETNRDLDAVSSVLATLEPVLPCGSAGLARGIASRWNEGPAGATTARAPRRPGPADVLVVVGSANPIAHHQLDVLARATAMPVVTLEPAQLANPASRDTHVARARDEVRRGRGSLAITVSPEHVAGTGEAVPRFETDLAQLALAWAESRGPSAGMLGVVCTGGDTTLAVCRALGIHAIWPEGEISAGVPWSAVEGPARSIVLVSKAGGFGSAAALLEACRFLRPAAGRDPRGVSA